MTITATGMNESLALGKETSFKTVPGTPNAYKVPVTNPSIKPSRNKFQSNALTGSAQPNQVVFGKTAVDGSFALECNKESLMPVLEGIFSAPTSTTIDTGYYQRIYTLGIQPSWFIEQSHTDVSRYFLWTGCYMNSAAFTFGSEGLMEASVNIMGAKQTIATSTAVTGTLSDYTDSSTFSYLRARIKQGGTVVGWSQEVSLDINRNGYREFAQDETNEVALIGFGKASITGRITALFQDAASFISAITAAQNGTETSIEIFVPAGNGHGALWVLPCVVFDPTAPTTSGTGVVKAELTFTAYARGSASATAGGVRSKFFTTVAGLGTKTLEVEVDGAAAQTVTFAATDDTPDEVAAAINAQTTGCTASVERAYDETGGVLYITSDTTGTSSSIKVAAASTADTDLGFDNLLHSGLAGHAIVVTLLNDVAP